MKDLKDKVVVITGAAGGMGREMAKRRLMRSDNCQTFCSSADRGTSFRSAAASVRTS